MPIQTEIEDPEPDVPRTYKVGKNVYKAIPNPEGTGLTTYETGTARQARAADERFSKIIGELWTKEVHILDKEGVQRKLPRYIPKWYCSALSDDYVSKHLNISLSLLHRSLKLYELRALGVLWGQYQAPVGQERVSAEVYHLVIRVESDLRQAQLLLENDLEPFTQEELIAFDYDGRYGEPETWGGPPIGSDRTKELEDLLSKLLRK